MSSVVKFNRVIVDSEKKILFDNTTLFNDQNRTSTRDDEKQPADIDYKKIIHRAKEQAKKIILDAQNKAQQIKVGAQREIVEEAEIARKEGHDQGYNDGHAKGYGDGYKEGLMKGQNQGREEYECIIEEAVQIKQGYIEDYKELYRVSEENMLVLAIEIARKIIGDSIDKDDKTYIEMAYKALQLVQDQKSVQLKVSSQDYPAVMRDKDFLISRLEGIDDIEIVEDAFLERGSCIIDTGNGIIDGGMKTQLENIKTSFAELAGNVV